MARKASTVTICFKLKLTLRQIWFEAGAKLKRFCREGRRLGNPSGAIGSNPWGRTCLQNNCIQGGRRAAANPLACPPSGTVHARRWVQLPPRCNPLRRIAFVALVALAHFAPPKNKTCYRLVALAALIAFFVRAAMGDPPGKLDCPVGDLPLKSSCPGFNQRSPTELLL